MKIGVLLATYNGIKYIKQQLDSILSQTEIVDEIIISDDGSTDGTFEFCKKYAEKNKNIKIIVVKNMLSHGVVGNFQNAFNYSSCDYLFFADQDDVWKSEKVRIFKSAIMKYPQCGLFFSDADIVDDKLNYLEKTNWDAYFQDGKSINIEALLSSKKYKTSCFRMNYVTGMSMLVSRRILQKLSPLDNTFYHDDLIALYSIFYDSVCAINISTSLYRQHENNVMGNPLVDKNQGADNNKDIQQNAWLKEVCYYYKRSKILSTFIGKLDSENNNDDNKIVYKISALSKHRLRLLRSNTLYGVVGFIWLFLSGRYSGVFSYRVWIMDLLTLVKNNKYYRNRVISELL